MEDKKFPQFKPIAYFGGNLLLGGLSYILLRQYKRFFMFLGLMIVASFIPFGNYLVLFLSGFDAYSIARRLEQKEIPVPEYSATWTWVAIAIWVLSIIVVIASLLMIGMLA
ncbi:MAG TPA: hypothetical protein VEC16_00765 [Alphaproteobacteria bacterium]|nr:hypothetical protein [Alphaproteobacteria bacterium]